jgi:HPt (histidine-containing phosphotransfer) domain-containing protein
MSEVIERIKVKFVDEAGAALDRIDALIAEIQGGSSGMVMAARIREEAHGLKGAAAVLEYNEFRDRAAALEDAARDLAEGDNWPPGGVARLSMLAAKARSIRPVIK